MKRVLRQLYPILVTLGLGALSLVLVFPQYSSVPIWLPVVGMDGLLVGVAVKDLQEQRVPNLITYPLMLAAILRAVILRDPSFLLYRGALWLAWTARLMGAGDAKLLMGLFGLWPEIQLAYVVAAMILITGIPYLVYKYRRVLSSVAGWRSALRGLGWRLFTLRLLPSADEFQNEAVPYAFSFCLAGAVDLFLRFVPL